MNARLNFAMICGLAVSAAAIAGDPATKPAPAKPSTEAKPAAPAGKAEELTNATSEGAVKLFIKAMASGDFNKVMEVCDPTCEAFSELQQMAEAFDPKNANKNVPAAQLDWVKSMFTKHWTTAQPKLVVEQGPRAQYEIRFFMTDPKTGEKSEIDKRTVDLNQFNGKWQVLATNALIKPLMGDAAATQPPPAQGTPAQGQQPPAQSPSAPADQKPAGSH